MRKTLLLSGLVVALVFSFVLIKVAKAEDFGPPAGIPTGMPDLSQIPGGMPSGIPTGMPSGAPTNMGPSAEQLEQMNSAQAKGEERQRQGEAKQAEMEAKALEKMRAKAIPSVEKAVNNFKKQVDKLNKKGAPTTPAMQAELDKLDAFVVALKAADSIETAGDLLESFSDLADSAQEALQIMSKGAKWPAVKKQAEKLIKDLEKQAPKLQARAKAKGLEDELAETFAELSAAIAKQKDTLATLDTQVKTDPDAVFDNISDYFESFKDIYENYNRVIASSLDLKQAVKTKLPQFVNALDKRVKALAKNKKIDTTELKALVDQANAKLAEIKAMFTVKITDMDPIIEAISELTDIGPVFEDKWEEITGQAVNEYMPKIPADKKADYQVKLPPDLEQYGD